MRHDRSLGICEQVRIKQACSPLSLLVSKNEGTDQTVRIMAHDAAHFTFEPEHDTTNKITRARNEDSGQSGHPHSLIRVIVRCMGS